MNVSQFVKYTLVKKSPIEEKYHSLHPNLSCPCFNWCFWLLNLILPIRIILIVVFLVWPCWYWVAFLSSFIMNPVLCVSSSPLLIIPLHNTTQPISYYDDCEVNVMVNVAFGGSCGNINTVVDRSKKHQCKRYHIGMTQIFYYQCGGIPSASDLLHSVPDVIGNIENIRGWC